VICAKISSHWQLDLEPCHAVVELTRCGLGEAGERGEVSFID
jgi:hypothetical protein